LPEEIQTAFDCRLRWRVLLESSIRQIEMNGSTVNALQKSVVQVSRDSLPNLETLLKASLHSRGQSAQTKHIKEAERSHHRYNTDDSKQCRLVKRRKDDKASFCAGLIPNAVIVAGDHVKAVIARWQVGVKSLPPILWILPVRIMSLEFVAKADFLGSDKAKCRVIDFNISRMWRKSKVLAWDVLPPVSDDLLHLNRR
jgi:hypothetical protein